MGILWLKLEARCLLNERHSVLPWGTRLVTWPWTGQELISNEPKSVHQGGKHMYTDTVEALEVFYPPGSSSSYIMKAHRRQYDIEWTTPSYVEGIYIAPIYKANAI